MAKRYCSTLKSMDLIFRKKEFASQFKSLNYFGRTRKVFVTGHTGFKGTMVKFMVNKLREQL